MDKYSYRTIQLDSVLPHAEYDKYAELLAIMEYTLGNGHVSELAIKNCLLMHPIIVIRGRHNTYLCVAGLRTLNLAKSRLPLTMEIEAICLDKAHPVQISMLVSSDVIVTPLLYSVKSAKYFGIIYNKVPAVHSSILLSQSNNTRYAFAKRLGYAYNTLFPPRRKEDAK